jgi:hypothetical protein
MMLIVRLFPKTDINKIWAYIENDMVSTIKSERVRPLYATQSEGMMNVGVILDVDDPDDVADFLTDTVSKYDEIQYTKTISLMKTVFFPIPKEKPANLQRYVIRIFTHARHYKDIYNHLTNFDYSSNLFPIYITYSLGEEDIIVNLGADSRETVNKFVKENLRQLDGLDSVRVFPVLKAKRFASLEELLEKQREHLYDKAKDIEQDESFDWVEDFEQYALITGAFPKDI